MGRGVLPAAMMGLLIAVVIMQLLTLILIGAFVVWRIRFAIDVKRIADVTAADLLDRFGEDADTLSEPGVKDFARRRYIELSSTFGLPTGPADRICDLVWQRVEQATGEGRPTRVQAIYE